MSGFEERMIEAVERGETTEEASYEYVRESLADAADIRRKAERENGTPEPPPREP